MLLRRSTSGGATILVAPRRPLAIAAAMLAAFAACRSSNVEVRTATSPDAQLAGRTTFRILHVPAPQDGASLMSADPMLDNSITNRAIREEIRNAFEKRGYRFSPEAPDLDIAFYATAAPKLDIRAFDYGYTWSGFPRQYVDVEQYEQGTVIVDVVDPATHRLLWRGQGVARVDPDPNKYVKEIRKAVDEIVEKFPAATR
jgi:hypothetical protein